jgi:phytoene dehydrogenase-like protein
MVDRDKHVKRAIVIGSGPNGLAAAITLARAGIAVDVYEAEAVPGGACRTLPLTLPGFLHDAGSAVHPLASGSPFFNSLPLANYGLEWVHGDAPFAHPLDDGTAAVLERDLGTTARELGPDGETWRNLMQPYAAHWSQFAEGCLGPVLRIPPHPWLMARFGLWAMLPARAVAGEFKGVHARALFAGLAGHSFLSFDRPLSSAAGLLLGVAAHAVGWPVPRGGAQAITRALIAHLQALGGTLHVSQRIDAEAFRHLAGETAIALFDTAPRALEAIAGDRIPPGYKRTISRFKRAPGVFKIDYALSEPVPWRAAECRRAITVHLGGRFEEIAAGEYDVCHGRHPARPFILAAQPSLFDPARAPEGKHVLWAYCHVPNGSTADMTGRIEGQIERFAPGFRDCILARYVSSPAALEARNANLIGGDISGGSMDMRQFIFRPGIRSYSTGAPNIYLCSASTPPGGGVHGMCGLHAAKLALFRAKK